MSAEFDEASKGLGESQQHQNEAPQPPPFNPMQAHANQQNSLGSSVVPDLMKVYESLTQSSTPQDNTVPPPGCDPTYQQNPSYNHHQHYPRMSVPCSHDQHHPRQSEFSPPLASQQLYLAPAPAAVDYRGTGPPVIPPVPAYPASVATAAAEHAAPCIPAPHPPSALVSTNGRSLRKRSQDKVGNNSDSGSNKGSSKTRKKGNNSDGRWSKRFTWPEDLHRDFVSAIFDVGLKHSSPSAILEHMEEHEAITNERVKSHLQKYRLHRAKSKKEFMTCYNAAVSSFQANGMDKSKPLSSGEVAAHLSYSTMTEGDIGLNGETRAPATTKKEEVKPKPKPDKLEDDSSKLVLPQLSEDEKKSPIGTSLGYLLGLFFSLRQQLMLQRAAEAEAAAKAAATCAPSLTSSGAFPSTPSQQIDPQVGAMYSHFAAGTPQQHYQEITGAVATWQATAHHEAGVAEKGAVLHQESDGKLDPKTPLSTRTNFEENKLMKQEMKNQMAFQNKMRDLKQRELSKYTSGPDHPGNHEKDQYQPSDLDPTPYIERRNVAEQLDSSSAQGTGEDAEANDTIKGRGRSQSMATDDFWHTTDVVDDHLFEFLMDS